MLNVDWFQPFKRRSDYSVGVIYFVIMNLPRSETFKFENVILGGVIPSLESEPKLYTFLEPCVDELNGLGRASECQLVFPLFHLEWLQLYGVLQQTYLQHVKFVALWGTLQTKPAQKCLNFFPGGFQEKKDFSGVQRRPLLPKRDGVSHKRNCEKLKAAKSQSEYDRLSRLYGVHYSALCKLNYFDCVRFHVIDPMHNLFLGTAEYVFKLWAENIFSEQQLKELSEKINELNTAASIGRISLKIGTNYGNYTAEEWKNWTLTFSMYALYGILPDNHLRVWERFVLAFRILCQPVISKEDILKADALIVNFCTGMEKLYRKQFLTCNMHLHCHLHSVLLDYGPVLGFWLFSFERYNGQLGSTLTNNRSVEIQFMRDFLKERFLMPSMENLPAIYQEEFTPISDKCYEKRSSVSNVSTAHTYYLLSQQTSYANVCGMTIPI